METTATDVLIVGGGPVGLMLAVELQRRGVDHRAIDQRPQPDYFCKALGVSPRTQEVWDQCGVLEEALRRGTFLAGVESCTNQGELRCEETPRGLVPYGFLTLPQYDTEAILRRHLQGLGGRVEQGARLVDFAQRDDDIILARVARADGSEQSISCRYLVGCDGAHSQVRKGLGIEYQGDAYAMTFMLGDVLIHWDRRRGYGQRMTYLEDGQLRNVLICIPIPGDPRRYRISLAAPPEFQEEGADLSEPPSLELLRATVAPILPAGATISDLRWSSYYRISHRIVAQYSSGRCFLVGDAAHIHPPIGGQGMNTGIQDAHNLAWKLALAARGRAASELLDGYGEERRPVGLAVVERTTQRMNESIASGDVKFDQWMQDSQLLIGYRDSRWVGEDVAPGALAGGPRPGDRAPDAPGLRREWLEHPARLEERMRVTGHLLLLYFAESATAADFARAAALADELHARHGDDVTIEAIVAPDAQVVDHERFPILRDAAGSFRAAYDASAACLHLIRPDRHVGYRASGHDFAGLRAYLARILAS